METRIAKIISILFHPLLMPTYGFLILFYSKNYISTFIPADVKLIILSGTFVFTFLFPAINALILLRLGRIQSLEMETPKERIIPYASTAAYYFALFYLFINIEYFPAIFKVVILGAGISILLTLIITFRWKISAHGVGIGGILGALLGTIYRTQMNLFLIFLVVIFCTGIVSYARLKLNAHSPAQVYAGVAMGFFVELVLMMLY